MHPSALAHPAPYGTSQIHPSPHHINSQGQTHQAGRTQLHPSSLGQTDGTARGRSSYFPPSHSLDVSHPPPPTYATSQDHTMGTSQPPLYNNSPSTHINRIGPPNGGESFSQQEVLTRLLETEIGEHNKSRCQTNEYFKANLYLERLVRAKDQYILNLEGYLQRGNEAVQSLRTSVTELLETASTLRASRDAVRCELNALKEEYDRINRGFHVSYSKDD